MKNRKKARWAADLSLSPPSPSSASSACASAPAASSSSSSYAFGDDGGCDRLTALPDTIRLQILSLLPLKDAIRTGALSSSWRGLWLLRWPHPAVLRFAPPSTAHGGEAANEFASSVDRCLVDRCRGVRIDCLAVALPPGRCYDDDISRWLEHVASCGVEELQLVVSPPSVDVTSSRSGRRAARRYAVSSVFFDSLCKCSNLARFSLSGLHLYPNTNIKRFSSLEALSLHASSITDAALKKIVAACPHLRSLDLYLCRKLRRITITATSCRLTSLTIVDCVRSVEVTISAPGLRRFRFSGNYRTTYWFDNSSRLEDVCIISGIPASSLPRSNWAKALSGLSNVKILTLCNLSLQYIVVEGAKAIGEFRNFWNFRNLRELQLVTGMMTDDNLMDIYGFFKLCECPRLEKLFIELPINMRDPFLEKYLVVSEGEPPEVDFEHLKVIKINNFKGHSNEMRLVKFLLERAVSLESFVVIAPKELVGDECNKSHVDGCLHFFETQLLSFTRASIGAQIILSEHDDSKFCPTHN